ncbi:MAG: cytochrome P450 [Sphingobium sp.]
MATLAPTRERIPAHVPPELVWDDSVDRFSGELDDPYVAAARLHEGPDIVWATSATRNNAGWLLTRFDDIQAAYMDNERFSAREVTDIAKLLGVSWRLNPQEIDPPAHLPFRQVLQPWFQPSAVRRLEQSIREVCRSLIDELGDRRSFDFVQDFARFVPSRLFLSLMGLPQDRLEEFLEWEHELIRGATLDARADAAKTILRYLEACVEERRQKPGDDLISQILAARIDGKPLEHGDIMGMCMVLYGGGLDTVLGSLGWHMHRIAGDAELQRTLRDDPSKIVPAVDELFRAYGVVQNRRTVIADCEFGGIAMKAGDWIVLPTYLASRDPRRFENPHRIDLSRRDRGMTFGTGIHYCLGIHLARREVQIVFEEFLPRFPNIRLSPEGGFSYHTVGVWGVDALPIVVD